MGVLDGRVALVTGGGQGLGRAIALGFAAEGASLGLLDVNAEGADSVAAEIGSERALALCGDVSRAADCATAVTALRERFGRLDILVNNAVFARYGALATIEEAILDRMLAVGVKGPLLAAQAARPVMRDGGGGAIVNISSVVGLTGIAFSAAYASLKGALDAQTRALAVELGREAIRVNSIAPGAVPSAMSNRVLGESGWEDRRRRTAMGEIVQERDVVAAALYLASDGARLVTGVVLPVDAGFSIASMIPGIDLPGIDGNRI